MHFSFQVHFACRPDLDIFLRLCPTLTFEYMGAAREFSKSHSLCRERDLYIGESSEFFKVPEPMSKEFFLSLTEAYISERAQHFFMS